jgi:hypothetical protein
MVRTAARLRQAPVIKRARNRLTGIPVFGAPPSEVDRGEVLGAVEQLVALPGQLDAGRGA